MANSNLNSEQNNPNSSKFYWKKKAFCSTDSTLETTSAEKAAQKRMRWVPRYWILITKLTSVFLLQYIKMDWITKAARRINIMKLGFGARYPQGQDGRSTQPSNQRGHRRKFFNRRLISFSWPVDSMVSSKMPCHKYNQINFTGRVQQKRRTSSSGS